MAKVQAGGNAKEIQGGPNRGFRIQTGQPQERVYTVDQEIERSVLPPIEVKVNAKTDSKPLDIKTYEQGTGRS
jgi:hypothetical protein